MPSDSYSHLWELSIFSNQNFPKPPPRLSSLGLLPVPALAPDPSAAVQLGEILVSPSLSFFSFLPSLLPSPPARASCQVLKSPWNKRWTLQRGHWINPGMWEWTGHLKSRELACQAKATASAHQQGGTWWGGVEQNRRRGLRDTDVQL